jgi:hypothetical protein
MKKILFVFAAIIGLSFTGVAQSSGSANSFDGIFVSDINTGEVMIAINHGHEFSEGEIVSYRVYGPGATHWGNASFILVEIFPIDDPTVIGEQMQKARTGFKASHVTFGGGSTRID